MGRNPITYAEIKAFCELYAIRMTPNDVDILMQLDAVSLQPMSEKETK
jgi:hypothetical protein